MLKHKLKTKFGVALATCLLACSLCIGDCVYANTLSEGAISINNVQLDKNMKVSSQITGNVEATYDKSLANYIVSINKPKTIEKLDLAEELNHDRMKVDSNFIMRDRYFPLEEVGKIIVNNSLQYITIESNKDSKRKFTVNIPNTQAFLLVRVGILEMFDKTLRKYRELDEILDEYTITSLNENSNRKPVENLLALKLDKDRAILHLRKEIDIEDKKEIVKRIGCDLSDINKIKDSCHRDSYMVLSDLQNYEYKGSRIINISKDNQPSLKYTNKVSDWTIISIDNLPDGELDSSMFETSIGNKLTNTRDLNLCLHVTYNEKENTKTLAGTMDFIRIRNNSKSNATKLLNMWIVGIKNRQIYYIVGLVLIVALVVILVGVASFAFKSLKSK